MREARGVCCRYNYAATPQALTLELSNMNRFIWAFAAVALVLAAVVGFTLLRPTAERPNNPKPAATEAESFSQGATPATPGDHSP
ncbi:MAG: hypothetical protein KDB82_06925 [Planctomycetes bacterium]|nr:hypothetical protein [Planctomycetota bacterium]